MRTILESVLIALSLFLLAFTCGEVMPKVEWDTEEFAVLDHPAYLDEYQPDGSYGPEEESGNNLENKEDESQEL
jgi:hypothetical protein